MTFPWKNKKKMFKILKQNLKYSKKPVPISERKFYLTL